MTKIGEGNMDLEFMTDACLMKDFKILPSSIRNNNLDDLYYEQKKIFVEILGNSLEPEGLVKMNKFFKEQQKIEQKDIVIPPSTIKIIKENYGDKAEEIIESRKRMMKDDLIKELYNKFYGEKEN